MEKIEFKTEYFSNLLQGKISILVDQLPEDINNILTQTEISDNFKQDEIKQARNNMKEDKSSVSEEIQLEEIKRCNLDDIILAFANKLLDKGLKLEQYQNQEI